MDVFFQEFSTLVGRLHKLKNTISADFSYISSLSLEDLDHCPPATFYTFQIHLHIHSTKKYQCFKNSESGINFIGNPRENTRSNKKTLVPTWSIFILVFFKPLQFSSWWFSQLVVALNLWKKVNLCIHN